MATIRKRGDRWQVRVQRRGSPDQSKSFLNRADAERWGRAIEIEMDRGTFLCRDKAERITLDELLERYAQEVTPQKKGAEHELRRIRQWRKNPLASKAVASVRPSDFARYRDERLKTKAASTVRNELNVISAVFEVARKEWEIAVANPVRDVRKPTLPRGRDRRLIGNEEQYLLAECDASRAWYLGALVRLALETAAREGELHAMNWADIDLNRRTAFIRDSKNGESRAVPLSTAAIAVLGAMPRSVSGTLFPVTKASIRSSFHDAVKRARKRLLAQHDMASSSALTDLRFHDLRHEAVSRLFERGLNPMEVASISGHKTLAMLKRYTHLRAEDLARKLG